MELFKKFMDVVKDELNYFGVNDLSGITDEDIFIVNQNLKLKMVKQDKYSIVESVEVLGRIDTIPKENKIAYKQLKKKLETSGDVVPFLSKQAVKAKFQDLMLLQWKIHHFHLNSTNNGGRFNERSDYLLLVFFDKKKAYFIDIIHHNDPEVFVKQEYLEIIVKQWPELMSSYKLNGVTGLARSNSNSDLKQLWKAQINTFFEINGNVYAPIGGGVNAAGSGVDQVRAFLSWQDKIERIEEDIDAQKQNIIQDINDQKKLSIIDLKLDFDYYNGRLVLLELQSELILYEL